MARASAPRHARRDLGAGADGRWRRLGYGLGDADAIIFFAAYRVAQHFVGDVQLAHGVRVVRTVVEQSRGLTAVIGLDLRVTRGRGQAQDGVQARVGREV